MSVDPWSDIGVPAAAASLSARRASATHRWDFFWARDQQGKCLLLLQHSEGSAPQRKLPTLKGLEIGVWEADGGRKALALRLRENSQRAIFLRLAEDIIQAAESKDAEMAAVAAAVSRTWRWHHLLKGGSDGRLADDEQKGLIGELLILQRHLLPMLTAWDAVASWMGPLDAPKDFEIGRVAIEAKARRGAATPYVKISSEHQLDPVGCDCLLLHVVELSRQPSGREDGMTLPSVVEAVRRMIEATDPAAAEVLDGKLAAVGFRATDRYDDDVWVEGASRLYEVTPGFPSVTAAQAGIGVRNVQYSVELTACAEYVVPMTRIRTALEHHDHDAKP